MKILITGSRDWNDEKLISEVLNKPDVFVTSDILIHGACRGADDIAARIWRSRGGQEIAMPADWSKYGKRAGFVRNSEMVALKPDICLAFVKNKSKGAMMTVNLCRKAGIPVKLHEQ